MIFRLAIPTYVPPIYYFAQKGQLKGRLNTPQLPGFLGGWAATHFTNNGHRRLQRGHQAQDIPQTPAQIVVQK
jgi:hypothetical protein